MNTAEFQVPNFWGLVTVKGRFERVDGWLEIDESGQRRMTLSIDAASLHTRSGNVTSTCARPTSSTPGITASACDERGERRDETLELTAQMAVRPPSTGTVAPVT
jgi:hypothetical protein